MVSVSSSRKPLILYVEDSAKQRHATAELLEDTFEVLSAASAEEGLALADRYGERLDVALLDRMLPQPGMQGDELAQHLAERGHRVVMLSAKKGTDHRKELLGPAIVYLEKPIDPDELVAQLAVIARLRFADQVATGMNALATAALHTTGTFGNGLSAAQYIDSATLPPEQRPFVEALCQAAHGLQRALDQLTTFCRLRLGRLTSNAEEIRIAGLVRRCGQDLNHILVERNTRIEDTSGTTNVLADPGLLRVALEKMLSHAAGAATPGSAIEVRVTAPGRITVAYQGTGFASEALSRLFEPAPADPYKHHERDFGLGWVNAAMAAAALGGTLTVKSDGPDAGAVMTLDLP